MQLTCRQCGQGIHPRDVDLEALQARCRHCGWAFGKVDSPYRRGESSRAALEPEADNPKPGLPRPAHVEVVESPDMTTIVYSKRAGTMTSAWAVLPVVPALAIGAAVNSVTGSVVIAATVALAVAVFLGLSLMLALIPRGLELDAHELRVTIGPFVVKRLRRSDIAQLCVVERVVDTTPRFFLAASVHGVPSGFLQVRTPLDGLYLEQELERRLGLTDELVAGEVFGPDV